MRLAAFLPNWIGDVVMATPAINALWEGLRRGSLVAVGRPYVADVVAGSPWFGDFVPAEPKKWWATARKLRAMHCDVAVLFPNSFRSALVARMAGIPRRVGFARYGRTLLLTDVLQPKRDHRGHIAIAPIIDSYNQIVAAIGAHPGRRMRLFTTAADETSANLVWQKFCLARYPEVIALNPGAAFGSAKHWPIRHFATLARLLITERKAGVLVLCGPGEREIARQIVDQTQMPDIHSLADESLSIGLTKALVRRSDLLVTTDSGPRHFAAAFARPVVTLFGPTHIAWTETYYPGAIHLQTPVPCGPCQLRTCPLDHRCMNDLTPEDAFGAATRLLNGHREIVRVG